MTLVKTNGCKGFIVYLICDQDAIPNKKCLNDKQNLLDTQQMDIGAATQERSSNYLKKRQPFCADCRVFVVNVILKSDSHLPNIFIIICFR